MIFVVPVVVFFTIGIVLGIVAFAVQTQMAGAHRDRTMRRIANWGVLLVATAFALLVTWIHFDLLNFMHQPH